MAARRRKRPGKLSLASTDATTEGPARDHKGRQQRGYLQLLPNKDCAPIKDAGVEPIILAVKRMREAVEAMDKAERIILLDPTYPEGDRRF